MTATARNPESPESRRHFSDEKKRDILARARLCSTRIALEALLREEGIYRSQLSAWRNQLRRKDYYSTPPTKASSISGVYEKAVTEAVEPDEKDELIAQLQRRTEALEYELKLQKELIAMHRKLHTLFAE